MAEKTAQACDPQVEPDKKEKQAKGPDPCFDPAFGSVSRLFVPGRHPGAFSCEDRDTFRNRGRGYGAGAFLLAGGDPPQA